MTLASLIEHVYAAILTLGQDRESTSTLAGWIIEIAQTGRGGEA